MQDTLHVVILTPFGRYFEGEADFLEVFSEKYSLGILPNHAPLISTVDICRMVIRKGKEEMIYATSGGVINIDKDKVTLILNSIERDDEIDVERAKQAKQRAEDRLKNLIKDDTLDVNRAKLALLRATNRLDICSKPKQK